MTYVYCRQMWIDQYLKWNPNKFDGSKEIFFPADSIWKPEIFVFYSSQQTSAIESNLNVRINHAGEIRYYAPFSTKSLCPIDVKYFPFDKQHCVINVSTALAAIDT
ncbi:unnamed protein product [Soboliphyme baturini]|uniref:Neur_chan_LBD domain-containing protein n=1 Tax=Soboliphyme baturini TaxID=241478 RepID=A0A183IP91_9BILA|nr:unnamed protein product [Soboliphyme baturini]